MFTAAAVEEDHSNEYDVEINIAVVGDLGVGKSSIIDYETRETLQPSSSTDPYDGIHFKTKYYKDKVQFKMPETQEVVDPVKPGTESRRVTMSVNNSSNSLLSNMPKKGAGPLDKPFQFNKAALAQAHEYTVKVNYWDCSGNEEYLDLTCRLATGMAGVVYVYDVCNRSTFDDIELWMSELEELAPGKIDTDLDFVRMLLGMDCLLDVLCLHALVSVIVCVCVTLHLLSSIFCHVLICGYTLLCYDAGNQSNIGIEPGSALAKLHHGKDVSTLAFLFFVCCVLKLSMHTFIHPC